MRSLALRAPHELALVHVPTPTPGPYAVLLRLLAGGVCGTDLQLLHGRLDIASYPCLLGHESVGRVVACDERVRSYHAGDLVVKGTPAPPGTTYAGYASMWAVFSEFGLAFDEAAFRADHPPPAWSQIPAWADGQRVLPSDFDPLDGGMFVVFRETLSVACRPTWARAGGCCGG